MINIFGYTFRFDSLLLILSAISMDMAWIRLWMINILIQALCTFFLIFRQRVSDLSLSDSRDSVCQYIIRYTFSKIHNFIQYILFLWMLLLFTLTNFECLFNFENWISRERKNESSGVFFLLYYIHLYVWRMVLEQPNHSKEILYSAVCKSCSQCNYVICRQ